MSGNFRNNNIVTKYLKISAQVRRFDHTIAVQTVNKSPTRDNADKARHNILQPYSDH